MRLLFIAAFTLTLAACATQPYPDAYDPPGFFSGIWHGMTAGFALIAHIFDNSIRIYAFPNSGGWYDFGYLIGLSCWAGAAAGAK